MNAQIGIRLLLLFQEEEVRLLRAGTPPSVSWNLAVENILKQQAQAVNSTTRKNHHAKATH